MEEKNLVPFYKVCERNRFGVWKQKSPKKCSRKKTTENLWDLFDWLMAKNSLTFTVDVWELQRTKQNEMKEERRINQRVIKSEEKE